MQAQHIVAGLNNQKGIRFKNINQFYLDTPFHFHESCELVYIEKCFGNRVVGDNVAPFTDGDLVLMGPNLPHIWQTDSIYYNKDQTVKATVIYFSPVFLQNLTDDPRSVKTIEELIKRSTRGLSAKGSLKTELSHKILSLQTYSGLKKIIEFLNIIDILAHSDEYELLASEGYTNSYTFKDANRFNDVYQYIINNFYKNISLEEISEIAHMSPTAFCRYFKNHTQKSLTRFINEVRIGHACLLLQNDETVISNVCYECGYNNLVNFNKFFKSIKGITPSEYRRNIDVKDQ